MLMSIKRLSLIAALALCAGVILMSLSGMLEIYEYNVLSPKAEAPEQSSESSADGQTGEEETSPSDKLTELWEMMIGLEKSMDEMGGVMSAWGVVAYTPGISVSAGGPDGQPQTARLEGQWGSVLHPSGVLAEGRQLYLEEIELGVPSAVIDEKLAIGLYRVGNPVGRKIDISGTEFTVVGITRHSRNAGDKDESCVTVPLKALDNAGIQTQMLSVVMRPRQGSGAYAALGSAMSAWHGEGDFYSLTKEIYRARLPLRLLLCVLGAMAAAVTLKLSGRAARAIFEGGKRRMETRYALHILPELILRGLAIAAMYALNAAAVVLILQAAIAPVYVFPEWVPGILVDPKDIADTFWLLRGQETGLLSLRTPELLRLKYLHRLMTGVCLGIFILMLRPYYLWKSRLFGEK